MAIDNNSQLSSQDLMMGTSALTDLSTEWNNKILNSGLSSLNISGTFSALTGQGVGVSYIQSLENAIKKAEQNAMNISKIISTTAAEQEAADRKSAEESSKKPYSSYGGNNNSGGNNGGNNNSGGNNGGNYSGKDNPDTNIDSKDETEKQKLTEEEQVKLVETFQELFNGDLFNALFNKDFASKVKELLLASPNISENLKQILLKMDQNEIQVMLRDMYLSGTQFSGFSKLIVTVFDNNLKERDGNATIYDVAENISEVYSDLSTKENVQEELHEIYNGSAPIDEVDDETIFFTRDFIDTLAETSRTTPEEIFNTPDYNEALLLEVKDLANTFAILRGAKDSDSKITSKLYSNIIVKWEG